MLRCPVLTAASVTWSVFRPFLFRLIRPRPISVVTGLGCCSFCAAALSLAGPHRLARAGRRELSAQASTDLLEACSSRLAPVSLAWAPRPIPLPSPFAPLSKNATRKEPTAPEVSFPPLSSLQQRSTHVFFFCSFLPSFSFHSKLKSTHAYVLLVAITLAPSQCARTALRAEGATGILRARARVCGMAWPVLLQAALHSYE